MSLIPVAALQVYLKCTHMKALEYIPLETLKKYAADADGGELKS